MNLTNVMLRGCTYHIYGSNHIKKCTKVDKTILAVVKSQDGDYAWGQMTGRKYRGIASGILAICFLVSVLVNMDIVFSL